VSVRTLRSSDTIGDGRGAPVVLVAAAGSRSVLSATLRALVAHTGEGVPIVVACDDGELAELAALDVGGDVTLLALGGERGVGAALRAIHARAPHADVMLVGEGVLVGPGWLEGLREAAHLDSIVMTASPLSEPGADELAVDALAGAVLNASLGVRPTIARARDDCCYLRASALELVGPPAAGVEDQNAVAELSARISALGLVHILADEVCVRARPDEHLLDGDSSALRRSVAVARTSLRRLSVTVDARALGTAATGMRTYILDLIAAVAREESLRLRVLLPPDTAPEVLTVLEGDSAIEIIGYDEALAGVALTDVVHRPQQVFTADDLTLLRLLGERIVITHHDLIAYRCGAYHETVEQWRDFRRVTRLALAQADMAVFPSRHARDDALREDLIGRQRAHAVPDGAERVWPQPPAVEVRPAGVPAQAGLLVCIGADYAHKNRPFALALARALHERHGWNGRLVLAGPHVQHGSSRDRERALLERDPALAALVIDIGPVDDAGRAWLYAHAQAVVYPSVYEGFGLVPFEAAQAGVPCLYAPAGALGELAGPAAAALVAWDPDASADAVAPLLEAGDARESHVRVLREAAEGLSWANVIPLLRGVYEQAVASPYRAGAPRVAEDLERESHIVALAASAEHDRARASELQRANDEAQRANDEAQQANDEAQQALLVLRSSVGSFAEPSAGGLLSGAQRRGLLRVVSRPLLRRLLLAPFALAGRAAASRDADEQSQPPD
jgi:glycosyltransferase involved in cell wall biosynthesis